MNRTYAETAAHYGTAILPARPRRPRDKAKVEQAVLIVERWVLGRLRRRTFYSLADVEARATARGVSNGFFRKDEFTYDPEQDAYACPGGHELKPFRDGKLRKMTKVDYGNPAACRDCPLHPRCTDADYRAVSRLEHEDALDRMAARLKTRPEILDRRRETVEHPFGSIKQWMHQGAFLMRGLEKVRAEFSLTALVYNLRRALNILRMDKMTAAIAT